MAKLEHKVEVEVMDSDIVQSAFKIIKAGSWDMALGAALMGSGIVGLLESAGLSSHWFQLPLALVLIYRCAVSTQRMKKEMRAEESAFELRMEEEL